MTLLLQQSILVPLPRPAFLKGTFTRDLSDPTEHRRREVIDASLFRLSACGQRRAQPQPPPRILSVLREERAERHQWGL